LTFNNSGGGAALNETGALNDTISAPIILADNLANSTSTGGGAITVVKQGTGILALSGTNSHTGSTRVSSGALRVGVASVAGVSGAVGLNSTATLANVSGAALDLNGFNSQIGLLAGGGTTGGNVALGGGNLTIAGTTSFASFSGVISGAGNLPVTSSNWSDGSGELFNSYRAGNTFGLHQDGNHVYLTYTAVPEPGSALLGSLGAFALWRRRRRD
jgi:fibronectin-binding autotransporter adhesin